MIEQISAIARQAGQIILSAKSDKNVQQKTSTHDLVTEYDKRVQDFLQRELLALLPEAAFLGEEDTNASDSTQSGRKTCRFIVDPIDGTTNFVRNFRRSCTSIALEAEGQIQLGVIYDPYFDEMYTAELGKGAFCNGALLHIRPCSLSETVGLVGLSPYALEFREKTFRMAKALSEACIDVHRTGSAALDLCDLAASRAGAMYEYQLAPWDYAAASVIIREAGGQISDLNGRALQFSTRSSVAAGAPGCHEALLALYRQVEEGLL